MEGTVSEFFHDDGEFSLKSQWPKKIGKRFQSGLLSPVVTIVGLPETNRILACPKLKF